MAKPTSNDKSKKKTNAQPDPKASADANENFVARLVLGRTGRTGG